MPRPRKPTNILEMSGAYKEHPERKKARANEPKISEPLGNPPRSLNKQQKAIWRELIKPMPAGVLTAADRHLVELTCHLIARLRNDDATGADTGHLIKCLSQLGMTPADRSKVSIPSKKSGDKWDD